MTVTKIVHVVNRSLEPLEVMDDGIPWPIRPGYKAEPQLDAKGEPVIDPETGEPAVKIVGAGPGGEVLMEPLPYFAAERAKRQNPIMGTEDPYQANSFETLIAVPDWGDDYSYKPQSDAIERLDRSQLPEEAQVAKVIPGRGRRPMVKTRDPKTGRFKMVDPGARTALGASRTLNPAGIETRIDG